MKLKKKCLIWQSSSREWESPIEKCDLSVLSFQQGAIPANQGGFHVLLPSNRLGFDRYLNASNAL
jgi:hypothetical protein